MEAICKADYDCRIKASHDAEREQELRRKMADDAEKNRRQSSQQKTKKSKPTADGEHKDGEAPEHEVIIPKVGFHDIYGVWFFGRIKEIIQNIGVERFGVDLGKKMHVYVDSEPKHIADGVHDITVYGHANRLYLWRSQGYHRGLVVLADDHLGNLEADIYMESRTWSWALNDEFKARLDNVRIEKHSKSGGLYGSGMDQ